MSSTGTIEKRYHDCTCMCIVLRVMRFVDSWMDKKESLADDYIYVSVFNQGTGKPHNFSIFCGHCLKLIWKLIRTGSPYEDEIVLERNEAKRLGHDLITLAEMNNTKTGD